MSRETLHILTAEEIIAVDQDPLGIQGHKVSFDDLQVWVKPLSGENTVAVALYNRSEEEDQITAYWSDLELPSRPATVRDLWEEADLGVFEDSFSATVPAHGIVMVKIVSVADN